MNTCTAVAVGMIVAGGLMDLLDWLFYTPRGAIGFGRQYGVVGSLGRLVWMSGLVVQGVVPAFL